VSDVSSKSEQSFIHPVCIHLAALRINHDNHCISPSSPSIVQKTPNPRMLGHSVDDDLMIITLVAFPLTSRKTKSTIKAGRGKAATFEDVHATQLSRHDERPAAGDPAFAAIKRAQNEHAFRVPGAYHRCSSLFLLCTMLCQ
jgi:hypothetical protein